MKKLYIIFVAALLMVTFVSVSYADKAVEAAEAKFKEARKVYIAAQEELSDAQIDSLLTIGKPEKREAVERVKEAREEKKAAKKIYKETLHVLHEAEMARDAKIDRSPWN